MISNVQRLFTLAIAAALCIYAASASNAAETPNAARPGASDVASQEKTGAAPSDAVNAQDVLPARTLAAKAPAMRSCPH